MVAHSNGQEVGAGVAGDADVLPLAACLDNVRARLGDCEFQIFDVFHRERQAVRDRRDRESRHCDPFGFTRYAGVDGAQRFRFGRHLRHTNAFCASASSS